MIVKYRAQAGSSAAAKPAAGFEQRARELLGRHGLALGRQRALGGSLQLVTSKSLGAAELARRLEADAEVEFAVVDRPMRRQRVPNDPRFASGGAAGPAVGQWYLKAPAGEVRASIDAVSAWEVTTGSSNVVVAVLDTGVRFDHPDLQPARAAGRLLAGRDFVRVGLGNDGDGADADASDPGDWVTQADIDSGVFGAAAAKCVVDDSSWHGTEVAGIVGALSDNGAGIAGTDWNARILPVRVLGKCGGFSSDIIAGMRWAAGLAVPEVPANPTPARVLNMSLGGSGACDAAYQSAVDAVVAAGAVVVASAGNTAGHAVGSPANCRGVIAVGGLRHIGTKVGFSDLGAEVALSAPGGNCVNTQAGSDCLYPIATTANSGTTTPAESIYTDARRITVGTSFAAPMVAGTAALMLAVHPNATPAELRTLLTGTTRAFPTTGAADGTPQCLGPLSNDAGDPIDQLECYCTSGTCGAGMLDARAAVEAAKARALAAGNGVQALIAVSPASPVVGQTIALDASGSLLAPGRSLASVEWSVVEGGGAGLAAPAQTPQTTLAPTAPGTLKVRLVVTDSAGQRSTVTQAIDVASDGTAVADGGGGGAVSATELLGLVALLAAALPSIRRTGARRKP
ncbi:S8 family peptidase [Methylibium sp.]|uniref:S8 family peptidase n=1 Tax=Methylibium sp. TaxID=2067992 RepID=UPI002DB9308B|nr:S8 family peptidase [Methylibium sp.]